ERAGAGPQDLRGTGGILGGPGGPGGGHGQHYGEGGRGRQPLRGSPGERGSGRRGPRGLGPEGEGRGRRRPVQARGREGWPPPRAEMGLIDEYEVYLNPLVWGGGNLHVLGDRGTIRMELDDMRRFDSGVVLLTYRPAS